MKNELIKTPCALLNIHFLMSSIMDKNNVMYAGFTTLPLSLFAFSKDAREVHGCGYNGYLKPMRTTATECPNRKMGYKAFLEENLVKLQYAYHPR
jgi:hypothetical protein